MTKSEPREPSPIPSLVIGHESHREALRAWDSAGRAGRVTVQPIGGDGAAWVREAQRLVVEAASGTCDAIVCVVPSAHVDLQAATAALVAAGADDVLDDSPPTIGEPLTRSIRLQGARMQRAQALVAKGLTGCSPAMRTLRRTLTLAVDDPDLTVLLLGETGTGKALAARALHESDPRRHQHPFHALDCGASARGLFGSELFGHVKGAFTGADRSRAGAIATAGRGTLLLDEIGDLPLALQSSLLVALQERQYRSVGSDVDLSMKCRVLSATNRNLTERVHRGRFRADLYHRLNGLRVVLPPLRDRLEDVPTLFRAGVERSGGVAGLIAPQVFEVLTEYRWPGNIRELEAVARQAARMADGGDLHLAHLPVRLLRPPAPRCDRKDTVLDVERLVESGRPLREILQACTERAVRRAWGLAARSTTGRGNRVKRAAELLGQRPRWFYERMAELGVDGPAAATNGDGPPH